MYQPAPVSEPGGISLDAVGMAAAVPMNVPPGLEYLTQVRTSHFTLAAATPVYRGFKSKSGWLLPPSASTGNDSSTNRDIKHLYMT